ncbi:MAG: SoxR reducing system RseC family protein [Bacteroidales bacterium]|jgi:sigma-E factor negative regulatory protein RseC|nr:SoxR reducing system RseC family protein [Bacteroidales bacterium]MDI9593034.1 SoxR reducing system RseC family protein [Bacteroidota bacterium]OQC36217.1 MAG: Positive regulator of sigma(E), RseC/MucC [Bacteroidetes bacterium ADurb.Bin041]MBP7875305.1 SoxR reducing system RseC family protein [Bacteroidales bacterium]MCO6468923.1 SoxR reducing system RseC family protein [Bacteroidales bacterium]
MSQELISHKGYITEIEQDLIRISIIAESACSGCHAKGFCSVADTQEKIIETPNPKTNIYKIGDQVEVTLKKSHGLKAVFYGYFLPFILVIISLLIIYKITKNQAVAGLISLTILIPYYIILYFLRKKMKSSFLFAIKH